MNKSIHKLKCLTDVIFMKDKKGFIAKCDGQIFKMIYETNTHECMKLKDGRGGVKNVIELVKHCTNDSVICLMDNKAFKIVDIVSDSKVHRSFQVGFVCSFCVTLHQNQKRLLREHMNLHYGPVNCNICKVR